MYGRIKSDSFSGLTPQQIRAMQANSPTPKDILENPAFAKELHEEVTGTYSLDDAYSYAEKHDKDIINRSSGHLADNFVPEADPYDLNNLPPVEKEEAVKETPVANDEFLDAERELERQLEEARAARLKREEAAAAAAAEAAAQAQEPEEEVDYETQRVAAIKDLLSNIPGAPDEAGIQRLKQATGNSLYVTAFGENEAYLFTHLKRGQFQKIQEVVGELAQADGFTQNPEDAMKEKVLQHCVVWPRPLTVEFFVNSRAGIVDSLYQNIMLHSYFLTPQQSLLITAQL